MDWRRILACIAGMVELLGSRNPHPELRHDRSNHSTYSPVSNIGDIRSLEEGSDEGSIVLDIDEVGLDAFLQQFI